MFMKQVYSSNRQEPPLTHKMDTNPKQEKEIPNFFQAIGSKRARQTPKVQEKSVKELYQFP